MNDHNGHRNDDNDENIDDNKAILKAELQRLQEENFDLQATIATLQAEQSLEVVKLRQEAASNESKLRAELRLAQQQQQRQQQDVQRYNKRRSAIQGTQQQQHQEQELHPDESRIVDQEHLPTSKTVSSASLGWHNHRNENQQHQAQHALNHEDFRTRTNAAVAPNHGGTSTSTRTSWPSMAMDHSIHSFHNNGKEKENESNDVDRTNDYYHYKYTTTNNKNGKFELPNVGAYIRSIWSVIVSSYLQSFHLCVTMFIVVVITIKPRRKQRLSIILLLQQLRIIMMIMIIMAPTNSLPHYDYHHHRHNTTNNNNNGRHQCFILPAIWHPIY
jgi:hypothetical protein